jgi:hypothetical protein
MRTTCEHKKQSARSVCTYLNGAEDPQNEGLHDRQDGSAHADHEVDTDVLANVGVSADLGVLLGPRLQPKAPGYAPS